MSYRSNPERHIPLMFRAQIKGRSQLHFISKERTREGVLQDSERWVSEWIERVEKKQPEFGSEVRTRTYRFPWRFVTNGGQDEGIIRPVMGTYGIPFYPGSSMKGVFCQACTPKQKERYRLMKDGEQPSLLRFHGGYPTNDWTKNLLDLVHPQQGWQVKTKDTREKPSGESAFALISLYEPTFEFGISSVLPDTNWDEVWQIWEEALSLGLGCRTSSGYGLADARLEGREQKTLAACDRVIYRCYLKGQGQAPKLIGREAGEFRPNIFRGAIRGHALRLFGGLTSEETAEDLVEALFGGVQEKAGTQGLLGIAFKPSHLTLDSFQSGYHEPTYNVTGELQWLLTQSLPTDKEDCLQKLLRDLMRFAMLLGGFGKSWRHADHRKFYPDYYERHKPLIGCHWEWHGRSVAEAIAIKSLKGVAPFLNSLQQTAKAWMQLQGIAIDTNEKAPWREILHPNTVEIWGRIAEDEEDSLAIRWFHQPYRRADRRFGQAEGTIKHSSVTGSIGQIGRIWHRMNPIFILIPNSDNPQEKKVPYRTPQYLELLTIFPDNSDECLDFLGFLDEQVEVDASGQAFQQLWGFE